MITSNNIIVNKCDKVLVFSNDNSYLKKISGIIDGTYYYEKEKAYDNEDYFLNRIYIDFASFSLNTLSYRLLNERFISKYGIKISKKKYLKYLSLFNINKDVEVNKGYHFVHLSEKYALLSLILSTKKDILIMDNFEIQEEILQKKEVLNEIFQIDKTIFIKSISFPCFYERFNKVLFHYNDNETILSKNDKMVIARNEDCSFNDCVYRNDNYIFLPFEKRKELKKDTYKVLSLQDDKIVKYLEDIK